MQTTVNIYLFRKCMPPPPHNFSRWLTTITQNQLPKTVNQVNKNQSCHYNVNKTSPANEMNKNKPSQKVIYWHSLLSRAALFMFLGSGSQCGSVCIPPSLIIRVCYLKTTWEYLTPMVFSLDQILSQPFLVTSTPPFHCVPKSTC